MNRSEVYTAGTEREALSKLRDNFPTGDAVVDTYETDSGEVKAAAYSIEWMLDELLALVKDVVLKVDDRTKVKVSFDEEDESFYVKLKNPDAGKFIGYHGKTLDSLQLIIAIAFNKKLLRNKRVTLDIDNYREKRKRTLEKQVKELIEEIEQDHEERAMPNLLPKERRVVHEMLNDHSYLTTESRGEGKDRTLYIMPQEMGEDEYLDNLSAEL